jgi:hypothetical protein
MAKSALPALDGNNGASGLNDVERERAAQTESDAVVDLDNNRLALRISVILVRNSHQPATDGRQYPEAQGTRTDRHHGGGGSDERSAHCE